MQVLSYIIYCISAYFLYRTHVIIFCKSIKVSYTTNGVPTITVRDTKNNSRTNVKTCILGAAPLSPDIVLQENKTTEVHGDGSTPSSKYIRNGILYIRFNGKTYNAQGQRIDLFGWGTGANPTKNSADYNDYSTFTDSGTNPITNGGNQANMWRTLTNDEWNYLFNARAKLGRHVLGLPQPH